jgi:hypothetical protein
MASGVSGGMEQVVPVARVVCAGGAPFFQAGERAAAGGSEGHGAVVASIGVYSRAGNLLLEYSVSDGSGGRQQLSYL